MSKASNRIHSLYPQGAPQLVTHAKKIKQVKTWDSAEQWTEWETGSSMNEGVD